MALHPHDCPTAQKMCLLPKKRKKRKKRRRGSHFFQALLQFMLTVTEAAQTEGVRGILAILEA